jgi:alpha-tubulin suppressor-like RCC1 family protein
MFKISGQLGTKTERWKTPFPLLKTDPNLSNSIVKVKAVSTGAVHTTILTETGVWTFGSNDEFQLGRDGPNNTPALVVFPEEFERSKDTVVSVCCGAHHTLVSTEKGFIYSWGWVNIFIFLKKIFIVFIYF